MTVAQLDEHRTFTIGGSDAAAACGVDPFRSPVMLWAEKSGRIEREPSEAMLWGQRLEPVIFGVLEAEGYELLPAPADGFRSDKHPYMTGHPDAFVALDGERALVSVKTTGQWAGHAWTNGSVPIAYQVQELHYLALTGLNAALFACLIGGQRLEIRTMQRDDKAIARIIELEAGFYEHLRSDTPPPASANGDAALIYPEAKRELTRLTGEAWKHHRKLKMLAEQKRIIEAQYDAALEVEKANIGDAATALSPYDEVAARWTPYDRTALDSKALREAMPATFTEFSTTKTLRRFTLE